MKPKPVHLSDACVTDSDPQLKSLSVIIAAYNAEITVAQAIDSVLDQEADALEVLVVDDGSSDATAAVAQRYGEPVRCIRQANGGVAAARNRGVAEARGDWVAFLDADDRYYPSRIRRQRELLRRYPDVDLCIGNYHYVCPDGSLIRDSMATSALGNALLSESGDEPFRILGEERLGELVLDYFGHTLTFSLPRSAFLALGGYPPGIHVGEDLNLLIRACAGASRVGVICAPLGAYLVHDRGLVRSDHLRAQRETVRALQLLMPQRRRMPGTMRRSLAHRLRNARYDLATALVRDGARWRALGVIAPSLLVNPGWGVLRDLISVARG